MLADFTPGALAEGVVDAFGKANGSGDVELRDVAQTLSLRHERSYFRSTA
jgi:hypothetical protein